MVQVSHGVHRPGTAGRELLDGRSSIVLSFRPRSGTDPSGRAGKILVKFAGRAWIDEEDKQLVRVDAQLHTACRACLQKFSTLRDAEEALFAEGVGVHSSYEARTCAENQRAERNAR